MATDLTGATRRARVGGSGFTVFSWDSKAIGFARQISHQSPTPVGPGTSPIHPLDEPYPVQLITPLAASMGTLTLELYELFGEQVWERLTSGNQDDYLGGQGNVANGPVDIVGIFNAVANSNNPIRIVKYIQPPKIRGKKMAPYTEEYHNCVISQVMDGETIEIGTMEVLKQMVVNYTFMTRGGRNPMLANRSQNLGGVSNFDSAGPTGSGNPNPGTNFA